MSKKTATITSCDIDLMGDTIAPVRNLPFNYNGQDYEIVLCNNHLDEFLTVLLIFKRFGRRTSRKISSTPNAKKRTMTSRRYAAKVRKWWYTAEGVYTGIPTYQTGGRIPSSVKKM